MIKQKGADNITVEELVEEITARGRGLFNFFLSVHSLSLCTANVPPDVKAELLQRIRRFLGTVH